MSDAIDEYLAGLQEALPRPLRHDVVDEVEDHLRESAAVHGADEAVARFGPARELGRVFAVRSALRDVRRASLLLLLAVIPLVVAAFPLPHGLLPAWGATPIAEWPQRPIAVADRQDAILILLLACVALVLAGVVTAAFRRVRLALLLHFGALLSTVALGLVVADLAVRWARALPAAPSPAWIVVYGLLAVSLLAVAGRLGLRALTARLRAGTAGDLVGGRASGRQGLVS